MILFMLYIHTREWSTLVHSYIVRLAAHVLLPNNSNANDRMMMMMMNITTTYLQQMADTTTESP